MIFILSRKHPLENFLHLKYSCIYKNLLILPLDMAFFLITHLRQKRIRNYTFPSVFVPTLRPYYTYPPKNAICYNVSDSNIKYIGKE